MKYFIVSDIHGYYIQLIKALTKAGFFSCVDKKKLIVCGDMLDRGPEVKEVIKFMLELKNKDELIFIRGNHEDLLETLVEDLENEDTWEIAMGYSYHIHNGTWDTALQLSGMTAEEALINPSQIANNIRNSEFWTKLLPYTINYFEFANYICVHGWIPTSSRGDSTAYSPHKKFIFNPNWKNASEEDWKNSRWYNGMEFACKKHLAMNGKTIVCGHRSASYGHAVIRGKCPEYGKGAKFYPFRAKGIVAIDACTYESNKVNCLVLSDEN